MEIDDILHGAWPPSTDAVRALLDEACVDAYDEYEQTVGMHCVIEDWGRLPCPVVVGGQRGELVEVDQREASLVGLVLLAQVAAVPIPLEDVTPDAGTPAAFMVAMYRLWRGVRPVVVEVEQPPPSESDSPDWATVRARLEALESADVTALVGKLYSARVGNRRIVHEALGLPPPDTDSELLSAYKRKLARYIAPGPDDSMLLDEALELLDAYQAEAGDDAGLVELCVHGLETGGDAIAAYGSLFSDFYDTMLDVAVRCVDLLNKAEGDLASSYARRLQAVQSAANEADYGYGDRLWDVLAELDGFCEE